MKKLFTLLLILLAATLTYSQVRLSTAYNYPTIPGTSQDSVLNGLKSIRGCYFDNDMDGDGKSEMAVTNYNDLGRVHLFETVGNDSIKLVWASPSLLYGLGPLNRTPRYVIFGDLDNDGKKEIIAQGGAQGIYIFEWDGVVGSDNYGTLPSQVINSTTLPEMTGVSGNCEYMDIADVDGDGQNELLVAFNATTNAHDNYYIISAIGNWSTNDPGFSGFTAEFAKNRADLATYGLNGGNPFAMIAAQLNGTGNKEILIHNWHYKNITPLRVPSANTYVMADTSTGKQSIKLSSIDDVALFGGLAFDIDDDGREEIYLPTYSSNVDNKSKIHMVHYDVGNSISVIDTFNIFTLDLKNLFNLTMDKWYNSTYSMGYGDIDGNGKKNLYISSGFPLNLISAEFQGGDKTNMSNWKIKTLYAGIRDTEHGSITIKDSLGIIDTTWIGDNAIASKIFGRFTDFDKDGYEDILIPYQSISDSISIKRLTWNSGTSRFDTVTTTVANPKRWSFRIIEGTISTGVEAKDLTVITPDDYELYQNYPNPFNPSTEISFYLPIADKISLKIYNQLGQEVKTLISENELINGKHSVIWDATNNFGGKVASGLYIAQLKFGNFSKEIKMMMLK